MAAGRTSHPGRATSIRSATARVLALPVQCTLAQAEPLRAQLLRALSRDGEVHLDAARVEAADTAGLQVLAAFVQQVRQQGRSVHWHNPASVLLAAAAQLGLAQHLFPELQREVA